MKNKESFVIVKKRVGVITMITVGEMAPEFTLEGSNGEQVRLADFRGKM